MRSCLYLPVGFQLCLVPLALALSDSDYACSPSSINQAVLVIVSKLNVDLSSQVKSL